MIEIWSPYGQTYESGLDQRFENMRGDQQVKNDLHMRIDPSTRIKLHKTNTKKNTNVERRR
jgi:hypothetical protein